MNIFDLLDASLGTAVPWLLIFGGGFLWVRLRFFCFRHPVLTLREMTARTGDTEGISPIKALVLALAGTLGVGNIIGVAMAVAVGGPGSLLWMWVCACFAAVIKYSEIVLTIDRRRTLSDGSYEGTAALYIGGRSKGSRCAAFVFSVCTLCVSLLLGAMIQGNAVAGLAESMWGISPYLVGGILLFLTFSVVFGGAKGVSEVTYRLLPAVTLLYMLMCSAVLVKHRTELPHAFWLIVQNAFDFSSAGGGFLAFLFASPALHQGCNRGLISNEAGCGTAPIAHATAHTDSPVRQGLLGLCEVSVDTLLLCTLTGLAILVTGAEGDAVEMLRYTFFSVWGGAGDIMLMLCVFLFAFSTVICWSHYGSVSLVSVTDKKSTVKPYLVVFCLCVALGCAATPGFVWRMTDVMMGIMTVFNTTAVLCHTDRLAYLTEEFYRQKAKEKANVKGTACRNAVTNERWQ